VTNFTEIGLNITAEKVITISIAIIIGLKKVMCVTANIVRL
jgi:hypothetical protein